MRTGCAASALERIKIHELRHSHASLLIAMGVPILLISERLGHVNPQITLRVHAHLFPGRINNAVAKMNDMIEKGKAVK